MKKIVLILVCCFLFNSLHAQVIYNSSGKKGKAEYRQNAEKKGFDPHKLIFGGGVGFGFADGELFFSLSPIVGYRITNHFAAGLRLGYQYNWIKNGQLFINGVTGGYSYENLNYHVFAPGVWTRFLVWNNIFLYAEYEYNTFTYKAYETSLAAPGYEKNRTWDHANCLLLGVGFRQPLSNNSSFYLIIFYDALQNIPSNQRTNAAGNTYSISPYAGRIDMRIGFNVGI